MVQEGIGGKAGIQAGHWGFIIYRPTKKMVKKADIVCIRGRGVNPSSLIKPKITGFSNHSEMAFGHHNMNANASGLAWLGPPISSFPPNTSLYPV